MVFVDDRFGSMDMNHFQDNDSKACVYSTPCLDCSSKYIGETSRSLKHRILEHKYCIKSGNLNNALFCHISSTNHNINFDKSSVIVNVHNKRLRQILEASVISSCNNMNLRLGFFHLHSSLSKLILKNLNISKLKYS